MVSISRDLSVFSIYQFPKQPIRFLLVSLWRHGFVQDKLDPRHFLNPYDCTVAIQLSQIDQIALRRTRIRFIMSARLRDLTVKKDSTAWRDLYMERQFIKKYFTKPPNSVSYYITLIIFNDYSKIIKVDAISISLEHTWESHLNSLKIASICPFPFLLKLSFLCRINKNQYFLILTCFFFHLQRFIGRFRDIQNVMPLDGFLFIDVNKFSFLVKIFKFGLNYLLAM